MQAELLDVYKKGKIELGDNEMSWKKLAKWIEQAFKNLTNDERKSIAKPFRKIKSVDLMEGDRFRQFCTGDTSKMKPAIKMIAIEIWLTEKDDYWSTLTTKQLKGFKDYSKVAVGVDRFLNEDDSCSPLLDADVLVGAYIGKHCIEKTNKGYYSNFSLKFEESLNPRILNVTLKEEKTIRETSWIENETEFESENFQLFSGWVVLPPEDNLVCFLKNAGTGENSIYHLISIDGDAFNGVPANCLFFLDRQIPSEIKNYENTRKFTSYLMEWVRKNKEDFIRFQRKNDEI